MERERSIQTKISAFQIRFSLFSVRAAFISHKSLAVLAIERFILERMVMIWHAKSYLKSNLRSRATSTRLGSRHLEKACFWWSTLTSCVDIPRWCPLTIEALTSISLWLIQAFLKHGFTFEFKIIDFAQHK